MIDLHIHSNASDGSCPPSEILTLARGLKLKAISITDHDTVDGSKAAINIGIPEGLEFVPGIEISAYPPPDYPCTGSFHILGYFIRLDDPELKRTLEVLQEARRNRNPQIIERLNSMGFDMTLEEVAVSGNGQIGRPHIARLMVKKGFVQSINEAFDKYLGKGMPAYVDKYRMTTDQALKMIRDSGGIPVLAHPGLLKPQTDSPIEVLVEMMKDMGMMGIEVFYPEHSKDSIAHYSGIAERLGLLITGGTDFHGTLKPSIKMGSGKGNFFVSYRYYEELLRASHSSNP